MIIMAGSLTTISAQAGTDFCIDPLADDMYILTCLTEDSPRAIPETIVTVWFKDGVEVSRDGLLNSSFYAPGTINEIFAPGVVNPVVLGISGASNQLSIDAMTFNVSMMGSASIPMDSTSEELRARLVQAFLGNWTCQSGNVYGRDSETTIIRSCGKVAPICMYFT